MVHRALLQNSCLLLLLFLTACSSKKNNKTHEPVLAMYNTASLALHNQNGIFMQGGKPFTGYAFTLNNTDTTEVAGFNNGREHGIWRRFYPGNILMEKRTFTNGIKTGELLQWWPNGIKKLDYFFINNEYEGVCKEWNDKGILMSEMTYKNGHEEGSQKQYYPNGKIKMNYIITNGRRYGLLGTKNCVNVSDSIFKK